MQIVLADLQPSVIAAWQNAFANVENVTIHHGSIFEVAADALVSPANSFGFMDGGLDLKISERLGWHIQDHLQTLIKTKHHGELLIGQAEIVPTGRPKLPYIIAAPTMRVPMILGKETVNIYLATRAVLHLIQFGQLANGLAIRDVVQTVVLPGMGTGVGRVPPETCARQMLQAWRATHTPAPFPASWQAAQKQHQLLYSDQYRDLQF